MEKSYITFQINKKEAINIKFLVYRDKKQNSNYFYEKEKIYQNINEIRLLSENEEEIINLSDDTIQTFISCCQAELCRISITNIIEIQYLSNKFGVIQLITHISKYLSENWLNHALDSLLFKIKLMSILVKTDFKDWEEKYYNTANEEIIIGTNLNLFINQEKLLSLPISIINKIFTIYNYESTKNVKIEILTEFLFKCLNKYK